MPDDEKVYLPGFARTSSTNSLALFAGKFGFTTSAKRTAALPDVPPLAEAANIPGYDIGAWIGYAAPAGTPHDVRMKLAAEIQKAVQSPELKDRYLTLGMDPASNTPDEMGPFLKREQERYGTIIRNAGIKIEQ